MLFSSWLRVLLQELPFSVCTRGKHMNRLKLESFGCIVETAFGKHFIRKTGSKQPIVWIEAGLGSLSAEWWSIQDKISDFATVISYDRLGYGWSSMPKNRVRTPQNIADEMFAIMKAIGVNGNIVFIGHSQGGINIRAFLKRYPDMIQTILLLDPLSPNDGLSKQKLSSEVYKRSGFEKAKNMVYMKYLAQLRILPIFKTLIMQSPPFYYFENVSAEAKQIIWQSMLKSSFYKIMLDEYNESHKEENLIELREMRNWFSGRIVVMYHDPKVLIDEIVQYGGLPISDAIKVDDVWREIIGEYCELSNLSEFVIVENATHYIQQSRTDSVIENCLKAIKESVLAK